jgi:hypothetical protein
MALARGWIAIALAVAVPAATARAEEPVAPPVPAPAPAPVAAQPAPYDGPPAQPAPAPQPVYPLGYTPWNGNPQPYGGAPTPVQLMAFEDGKKNPAIALLLEFVMAGVGSIYADHVQGALITWGGMLAGVVVLVVGIDHYHWQLDDGTAQMHPDNSGATALMVAGALTMFGFRIYGLVDSWQSANDFNRSLAKRLGLPVFSATVAPVPTDRGLAWGPALQLRF